MSVPPRKCPECRGTGWVPYHQETIDGELEESFVLCPACSAPSCQAGRMYTTPCDRLDRVHHNGMFCVCDEHADASHAGEGEGTADEAVFYLKRWLWVAHENANHWLEVVIEDALLEAQHRLLKAKQERE